MNKEKAETIIETSFRKQVRNDKNVRNAYLLVDSEKNGILYYRDLQRNVIQVQSTQVHALKSDKAPAEKIMNTSSIITVYETFNFIFSYYSHDNGMSVFFLWRGSRN